MPAGKLPVDSARQTGDTLVPRRAGLASLMREMSLLMVLGFQPGWVNTWGGEAELVRRRTRCPEIRLADGRCSHLGGPQALDDLVGAGALIVLSGDHDVVGPNRKRETGSTSLKGRCKQTTVVVLRIPAGSQETQAGSGADLTLQWAAVTTQFSLIRDPPQKWKPLDC